MQLQQIDRINMKASPTEVINVLEQAFIKVIEATPDILDFFYNMDFAIINGKAHSDPFDRLIIASTVKTQKTLISSDRKFPEYRELFGLHLIEI